MELYKLSLLFFISGPSIIVDAHPISSSLKFNEFYDDASDDNGSSPGKKSSSEPSGELRRLGGIYR